MGKPKHREDCSWGYGFNLQLTSEDRVCGDTVLQISEAGILWFNRNRLMMANSVKFVYCPMCGVKLL